MASKKKRMGEIEKLQSQGQEHVQEKRDLQITIDSLQDEMLQIKKEQEAKIKKLQKEFESELEQCTRQHEQERQILIDEKNKMQQELQEQIDLREQAIIE